MSHEPCLILPPLTTLLWPHEVTLTLSDTCPVNYSTKSFDCAIQMYNVTVTEYSVFVVLQTLNVSTANTSIPDIVIVWCRSANLEALHSPTFLSKSPPTLGCIIELDFNSHRLNISDNVTMRWIVHCIGIVACKAEDLPSSFSDLSWVTSEKNDPSDEEEPFPTQQFNSTFHKSCPVLTFHTK